MAIVPACDRSPAAVTVTCSVTRLDELLPVCLLIIADTHNRS